MSYDSGPFFQKIARGQKHGKAFWLSTCDNVRIRVAHWVSTGQFGTVFLFPGRTEYIEKYGLTAEIVCEYGFDMITIDWRGQGLSDRLSKDPMLGHINNFSEYQSDLGAAMKFAKKKCLPEPWFILGHSMGGAIGLRAASRDLGFKAAVFTGPMWGILSPRLLMPLRQVLMKIGIAVGYSEKYAPTTSIHSYIATSDFSGNTLTNDKEMWYYMKHQVLKHTDLQLAGPSYCWVDAALREIKELHILPIPNMPALCFVGDREFIVDRTRIANLIMKWPECRLVEIPNALHEILMLDRHRQKVILTDICQFFFRHSDA